MNQQRQRISSDSPYEPKVGISRAIRSGWVIAVTGTAPLSTDGKTVAIGDPSGQARRCFENIKSRYRRIRRKNVRCDPQGFFDTNQRLGKGGLD